MSRSLIERLAGIWSGRRDRGALFHWHLYTLRSMAREAVDLPCTIGAARPSTDCYTGPFRNQEALGGLAARVAFRMSPRRRLKLAPSYVRNSNSEYWIVTSTESLHARH